MRLKLSGAILGFSVFLLMPIHARADAVYAFDSNRGLTWTFDVPSILTSETTIPSSLLSTQTVGGIFAIDGCSITDIVVQPFAEPVSPLEGPFGFLLTGLNCSGEPGLGGFDALSETPFLDFGTYPLTSNGTLEIVSTPESGSLILLALGLALLVGATGRKALRYHQA